MKNNDLISRSALIAEYDRVHVGPPGGARKLMEDAPAVDAAPVVRCLNCMAWDSSGWCHMHAWCTKESDFCCWGQENPPAGEEDTCDACTITYTSQCGETEEEA